MLAADKDDARRNNNRGDLPGDMITPGGHLVEMDVSLT
jgi:hypothetical protein